MLVFFRVFTRWKIEGRDNIPKSGPLLVLANHLTYADPPLVYLSLGREVRFMGKEELFSSPLLAYVMRQYGSFPVRRSKVNVEAIRMAENFLNQGKALIIFPEGRRSRQGQLLPAQLGSAVIAQRTGVPVLPVGVTGTEQMKGRIADLLPPSYQGHYARQNS